MTAKPNIADLRAHLFKQLDELNDMSKPADIARARAVSEVAQTVINTLKVEVEYLEILQGAVDVPFIEAQEPSSPPDTPPAQKVLTAAERMAASLTAGPRMDHPWRKRLNQK